MGLLWGMSLAVAGVQLQASDGVALNAETHVSTDATLGVLLVHMNGRSQADWAALSDRVAKNGLTTIAIDLRGHGQSAGDAEPAAMEADLRAAADWLGAQGVSSFSCVGAELGANLCLQLAREDARVSAVALLSPRLNMSGLNAPAMLQGWSSGRLLVAASIDDTSGSRCMELLARIGGDERVEQVVLVEEGVGTQLLSRAPSLEGRLASWLSPGLGDADLVGVRPDTTDETVIAAEGEKLQTHQ